jgi:hypothetical protein
MSLCEVSRGFMASLKTLGVVGSLLFFTLFPEKGWTQGLINNGLSCLTTIQDPSGSWGGTNGTTLRDTTTVLEALHLLGQTGTNFSQGIAYLQKSQLLNQDYRSRQVTTLEKTEDPTTGSIIDLLASQNEESLNTTAPNYPEGGWGIAQGFSTETLTTALALNALKAAGFSTGVSVVKAVVIAGTPHTFQLSLPAGASNLQLLIRETTGTVRVLVQTPSSGTFFVDLTNVSVPTTIPGFPVQAGTYTLTVQSQAGSPNTYSLEARFHDVDFDVSRITRALSYLGYAQNADGSWGISRGEDGLLMITAEVLQTLIAYGNSFGPRSAIDRGVAWLKARQNADGGFSAAPGSSTVYETALALLAIKAADPSSPVITAGQNFLRARQGANGCWNDDAYQTAVALRALPLVQSCRLDVDNNGAADVATDMVYIVRHLLNLPSVVPPSFRTLDPSIPSDVTIAAAIDALGNTLDVDTNGLVDVATDVVYIVRRLLDLPSVVPPSFRTLDPSIKSDATIAAAIDALCP